MNPVRMRIQQIMDFGAMVSISGIDLELNRPVVIHIDYRPVERVSELWRSVSEAASDVFEADGLLLEVGFDLETPLPTAA